MPSFVNKMQQDAYLADSSTHSEPEILTGTLVAADETINTPWGPALVTVGNYKFQNALGDWFGVSANDVGTVWVSPEF